MSVEPRTEPEREHKIGDKLVHAIAPVAVLILLVALVIIVIAL